MSSKKGNTEDGGKVVHRVKTVEEKGKHVEWQRQEDEEEREEPVPPPPSEAGTSKTLGGTEVEHTAEEMSTDLEQEMEERYPNIIPAGYESDSGKCITFSSHHIEVQCCRLSSLRPKKVIPILCIIMLLRREK